MYKVYIEICCEQISRFQVYTHWNLHYHYQYNILIPVSIHIMSEIDFNSVYIYCTVYHEKSWSYIYHICFTCVGRFKLPILPLHSSVVVSASSKWRWNIPLGTYAICFLYKRVGMTVSIFQWFFLLFTIL